MKQLAIKASIALGTLLPSVASAQVTPPAPITTPGGFVTILETVAGWFFAVFLALAVIFLLWAAFQYLTAAGNSDRVNSAKTTLIYSIVAIIVALVAGGIVSLLGGVIGVTPAELGQ